MIRKELGKRHVLLLYSMAACHMISLAVRMCKCKQFLKVALRASNHTISRGQKRLLMQTERWGSA